MTASVTRFPRGVPCPIWRCIGRQSVRAAACSAPLMTSAAWECKLSLLCHQRLLRSVTSRVSLMARSRCSPPMAYLSQQRSSRCTTVFGPMET
eukprot:2833687-Pyramimonas_sp.AAC.1